MKLSDCIYIILRTYRVRCTLNKNIFFIYSTRKEFLAKAVVELVYKFDEKYVFTLLPVRASEQGKVIGFGVHIYTYMCLYVIMFVDKKIFE